MAEGLLGPNAQQQLRARGLLGLGAGLLSASGPSVGVPTSLGQALGAGLQGGLSAQDSLRQQLINEQIAAAQIQNQKAQMAARLSAPAKETPQAKKERITNDALGLLQFINPADRPAAEQSLRADPEKFVTTFNQSLKGSPIATQTEVDGRLSTQLIDPRALESALVPRTQGGQVLFESAGKSTLNTSPEAIAKVQMVESSRESFRELVKMIAPDGEVNREMVFSMTAGLPFTEGRTAKSRLLDSIETRLRLESGAAVPETEVARAIAKFGPSPLDSDETIRVRLSLMKNFLDGAYDKLDKTGKFNLKGTLDNIPDVKELSRATEGGLSAAERQELEQLRQELGR